MKPKQTILFVGLAIGLAGLALWLTNRPEPVYQGSWETALQEARQGGYELVDTHGLWELYQTDPDLLIVDTRQSWEYRLGHIQGADNFSMDPTWWDRWRKRGEMREFLGEDKSRPIVFY
nr:rhodanese-like domain-containing protein [Desulfonatronovibrio hydrogenovorans]